MNDDFDKQFKIETAEVSDEVFKREAYFVRDILKVFPKLNKLRVSSFETERTPLILSRLDVMEGYMLNFTSEGFKFLRSPGYDVYLVISYEDHDACEKELNRIMNELTDGNDGLHSNDKGENNA